MTDSRSPSTLTSAGMAMASSTTPSVASFDRTANPLRRRLQRHARAPARPVGSETHRDQAMDRRYRDGVDRTSAVDGFRLAYERTGSGPAVVLLHGWPGDRTEYRA